MKFAGQVVWITGASSGIGEALAHAFASAGATLILSSRRAAELERVRLACARPDDHFCLPLDLAQSATFPAAVAAVLARYGRIDVLVNNAGLGQLARVTEADAAMERTLMEVDYFGPVLLTKACLPALLARRRGHLVVVSSVLGYFGLPGNSSYAAAKHALHGYFDSLRAEVWRHGLAVTLVCPGFVRTQVATNALAPSDLHRTRAQAAVARGLRPARCAAAILRAVARRREEIVIGGPEVCAVYLQRFAPWLLSRILRRLDFRS